MIHVVPPQAAIIRQVPPKNFKVEFPRINFQLAKTTTHPQKAEIKIPISLNQISPDLINACV